MTAPMSGHIVATALHHYAGLNSRYREKWPALRAVDGKARTYIYPPDAPRGSPDDAGTR